MATYASVIGPETKASHEGGIVYTADKWTRLQRFLILGSVGGSFYVNGNMQTADNIAAIKACIAEDGERVVREIVSISSAGRAPSNDEAIFALAACSVWGEPAARRLAFGSLSDVCRIGTHILHFVNYRKALGGGMGRGAARAVSGWFTDKSPSALAYQAVKYQQRDGYSLKDLLAMARPTPPRSSFDNIGISAVMKYIVKGPTEAIKYIEGKPYQNDKWAQMLLAIDMMKHLDPTTIANQRVAANLIKDLGIPREAVPSEMLNSKIVWEALLDGMPINAMVRNLGKMSSLGLLDLGSWGEGQVVHSLDLVGLASGGLQKLHPLQILVAMRVYEQGHGIKGSLSWKPSKRIINALDESFYRSFSTVEASGKRIRLALDVSASMVGSYVGQGQIISCREASAAMALVTVASEPKADVVGYGHTMVPLDIRPSMRLDEVVRKISGIAFGGTICSKPILDALNSGELDIESFVSYTDSETMDGGSYYGRGSGFPKVNDALNTYRHAARNGRVQNIVVGMVSNDISLANPADPAQLDVVGFDTSTPQVISDFIAGRL